MNLHSFGEWPNTFTDILYLECNIHGFTIHFTEIKIKPDSIPKLAHHGIISSGFHPQWLLDSRSLFGTSPSLQLQLAKCIPRWREGWNGYRIGMQAAHRHALRYDAHVVYLRHCALIHVAIQRHNFERTTHAAPIPNSTNVNRQRRENGSCYKSRGFAKKNFHYSILF